MARKLPDENMTEEQADKIMRSGRFLKRHRKLIERAKSGEQITHKYAAAYLGLSWRMYELKFAQAKVTEQEPGIVGVLLSGEPGVITVLHEDEKRPTRH